jgi:hypothetical protein
MSFRKCSNCQLVPVIDSRVQPPPNHEPVAMCSRCSASADCVHAVNSFDMTSQRCELPAEPGRNPDGCCHAPHALEPGPLAHAHSVDKWNSLWIHHQRLTVALDSYCQRRHPYGLKFSVPGT